MFKKLMESEVAKYIAATLCMLIVFALTLSMGASLASYTKDLGTVATISLMSTDDEHQLLMLHEGYRFRDSVLYQEPHASAKKLVFGTWNEYYDELGITGTEATLESFIRTGVAQNAIDCSQDWNRGILAFHNASTNTTYILSAQDRTLYANPNSMGLIYYGSQSWMDTHNGSIWNETLTEIEFSSKFDVSKVENFTSFFGRMKNLTTINGIKYFDTSSATNMSQMFYYLPSLASSDGWAAGTLNLTSFDTSKVTNMHGMFVALHSLGTLDLSSFDNSSLQYVGSFASGKTLRTIYVSEKWKLKDYPKDADGPASFEDGSSNLAYYNLSSFADNTQDMNGVQYTPNLASPGADTYAFQKEKNPNTYQSCDYANWLYGYFTLKDESAHHSNFTLSSGGTLRRYFMKDQRWTGNSSYNCTGIVLGSWNDYGVAAGGADYSYESFLNTPTDSYAEWTTGYCDNLGSGNVRMFANNGILYVLSAGHNTLYLNKDSRQMFALGTGDKVLGSDGIYKDGPNTSVLKITLDIVDARYCTNMDGFFSQCRGLVQISGFQKLGDTSKVTDMSEMFYYNFELSNIDLSKLKTDSVTNMYAMFIGCEKLTSIDLSYANFSKLKIAGNMFNGLKLCERIYVTPTQGHFPTLSTTNTSANDNLEQYNTKVFFNCPVLVGNDGTSMLANDTEYSYAYAHTNAGGFFSIKGAAKSADGKFNLPEGAITGLDAGLAPDPVSAPLSDEGIADLVAYFEDNAPENYALDSFVFYVERGMSKRVDAEGISAFLEEYFSDGTSPDLLVTPVYMPVGAEDEADVPFELSEGYISGLDIGLKPLTVDAPFEKFGDLFNILNWGEDNAPEGYLLDTFMFYTDYMYKEMYIEDAFDFLDAHYADGADTVFNVTPVYMPDPDYVPPAQETPSEEPAETPEGGEAVEGDGTTEGDGSTEGGTEGTAPEGDAPSSGDEATGDESGDTPSDSGSTDTGSESTDTPSEPSDTPSSDDNGDSDSSTPSDVPVETPSETPDAPVDTPDAAPVETPVVAPSTGGDEGSGSGSSGGESDSGSSSAPADTGSVEAPSSGEVSE